MGNDSKHSQAGDRAGAPPLGSRSVAGRPTAPGVRGRGASPPRPVARSTGRPAKITPAAIAVARRLSQADLRERLMLTEAEAAFLDRCSSGRPPRNAQSGLAALKLRLEYAYEKPKTSVELSGKLTLEQLVAGSIPSAEVK